MSISWCFKPLLSLDPMGVIGVVVLKEQYSYLFIKDRIFLLPGIFPLLHFEKILQK